MLGTLRSVTGRNDTSRDWPRPGVTGTSSVHKVIPHILELLWRQCLLFEILPTRPVVLVGNPGVNPVTDDFVNIHIFLMGVSALMNIFSCPFHSISP